MNASGASGDSRPRIAVAVTGAANTASVLAGFSRAGADAFLTNRAADIEAAPFAVLPGVGAFGPARERLASLGMDKAFVGRVKRGAPTLGVCLGMQLFCQGSEEAPGLPGMALVPGIARSFPSNLPIPQLGWNRTRAAGSGKGNVVLEPGWAYFANSYRLDTVPEGFSALTAEYGGSFVAALSGAGAGRTGLLLCQFHPELSGPWGLSLIRRWLGLEAMAAPLPPGTALGGDQAKAGNALVGTAIRVVPCLDLKNGRVVKGTKFLDLKDSGDPAELASRYEREGADEIALLDITATIEGRSSSLVALKRVRACLGIPILMGGGVRSEEDAGILLDAGADRVAVNSAAVRDPALIDRLASRFGVQCVVLAIDARLSGGQGQGARWNVVVEAGRKDTGLDAVAWAAEGARRGAGEILLTSMDRDGTGSGFDLELVSAVSRASGIPVIASGGASTTAHFAEAAQAGARAVLGAGSFHRSELTITEVKRHLESVGMGVRL